MRKISISPKTWSERATGLLCLLAFAGATATVALAVEGPREVVADTADRVLTILGNDELSSETKRDQIEEVVEDRIDYETLSRLVIARHWRSLDEKQQEEFVHEFRRHLSVTYGRNIESYNNERIDIVGDREEARGDWVVQTKIIRRSADDVQMDYRLREIGDEWKVIDVIIEGVSLVANFRSQFQEILSSGGFEKLISLLRKKNAAGEPIQS